MPETILRPLQVVAPFAWPICVLIIFFFLLPVIRKALGERQFSVEVGSVKVSVGDAISKLQRLVEDVQQEISKPAASQKELEPKNFAEMHAILWVDDFPENNAFQIDKLRRAGFQVIPVRNTSEGLERLSTQSFDLVISDMDRIEHGTNQPDAGLLLLAKARQLGKSLPFIFFTSQQAARTYGQRIKESGADVTSSTIELYRLISSKTGHAV